MFKTIVVAVDGSHDSDRAFELARAAAVQASSRLVVVHVSELVGGKGGSYPLAADEDELEARIEDQVEQLRVGGMKAELVVQPVRLGGPAHAIADIAEAVDADLIVVGSRGRSPVSELLLGSVPIRLIQLAHRPVLVVPARAAKS